MIRYGRSQWPRGLKLSTAARLLRSWVRIPPEAWMFVCCVLSGRDLCDELITRPEESYRPWRVIVCDHETSRTRRPWPALGCRSRKKLYVMIYDMTRYMIWPDIWYDIYLTEIGLTPGGSSKYTFTHIQHKDTENGIYTANKKCKTNLGSADRAPSLLVPWHLLYNWVKARETLS
jgi:hypothetical protein